MNLSDETQWLGPGPTAPPISSTTTITVRGQPTEMPYVPNDVTFEYDDTTGDITLTLGEWIRDALENAATDVCTKSTQAAAVGTKFPPGTDLCTFEPYVTHILSNFDIMHRAMAAIPEPLQAMMTANLRNDLITMGIQENLVLKGKQSILFLFRLN
jgi:hypothetical protein